jgi:hypothetical protein
MRRTKNWIVERVDCQWRVTVHGKDASGVEHCRQAMTGSYMAATYLAAQIAKKLELV